MRKSLIKIILILLIASLNWIRLSAVSESFAYYNDAETSSGNSYTAGTLDFSLIPGDGFSPNVTPTQSSSRTISVVNNSSLGFQYTVQTINATGTLCDYLNLAADLEGNNIYEGLLTDFNYNAGEFSTSTNDWQFTVSLTDDDPSLENQTCTFDFVFNGVQIGGIGFFDQEIISNTVTSGTWAVPTTANISPIADAYVYQGRPGRNYGACTSLQIRSKDTPPSYNKRTFIRFDFHLPSETTIISSLLKLYLYSPPSVERIYEARRVLGSWKERNPGGITWNNQPAVGEITDAISTGLTPGWLSWDVTNDVQRFVNGSFANYGWRLSDSEENSPISYEGKFYSRESGKADLRPKLEVTFIPPEVTTTYPVINEVYYHVGPGKGFDPTNEWLEIYNPTNNPINISGWKICDRYGCDTIPPSDPIPAKGFAFITPATSTWNYWIIPDEAIKIVLGSSIGYNGLRNSGDRVILKDTSDTVIDAMSYGDDTSQFTLPLSGKGKSLARIIKGYDTNLATDWVINATPNPGTNPTIDGVETITFTWQGVEFSGSEPILEEDEISNDLAEEEDLVEEETLTEELAEGETTVIEEEPTIEGNPITEELVVEEEPIVEEAPVNEESKNEELVEEQAGEQNKEEMVNENQERLNENFQVEDEITIEDQEVAETEPAIVPKNNFQEQTSVGDNASRALAEVEDDVAVGEMNADETGVSE